MNTKKLKYLYHLDSLRAIAVLLVLLFHLDVDFLQGGFIGVDVFFVISGFLITRILSHEFTITGKINFMNFYLKRIRRLIPTLFLILVITSILSFFIFSPSDFIKAIKSVFMSSIAISNFHFLGESGYFDSSSSFKPLLHTWSLGIEEQFYLLYPAFLYILMRLIKQKKMLITVLFILLSISLFFNIYTSKSGISENISNLFLTEGDLASGVASLQFYLLPFRIFEFMIGAIIAFIPKMKIKSEFVKINISLIAFLIIIISSIYLSKNTEYLSTMMVLPCIATGLLLYFEPSKKLSFIFSNKALIYLGKISYTLYIVHWVLIVSIKYIYGSELSLLDKTILFSTTIILSSTIYHFYELPIRYKKSFLPLKSNKILVSILVVFVAGFSFLSHKVNAENGWLWRLDKDSMKFTKIIKNPKNFHKNNWGGADYKIGGWISKDINADPDIFLMGDSHAGHLKYGLDHIFVQKHNLHIYSPYLVSSLRLPDFICTARGEKSKLLFESDLKFLQRNPNAIVVISHSWIGQIYLNKVYNSSTQNYESLDANSKGWKVVAKKIEKFHRLIGQNRKIVIIGETPYFRSGKINYVETLLRPKYLKNITPKAMLTFKNNTQDFNSFFETYFKSNKKITFINPAGALCNDNICFKQLDQKIYFSDSNHLTKEGSYKVIEYIEPQLLEVINN